MEKMQEYASWPQGYYHLCTDGKKGEIFFDEADYVDGMNDMALAACHFNVRIYAFELMRTHIHLMLRATGEECVQLFYYLRRRRNKHHQARGLPLLGEDYGFKLLPVESEKQMRNNYLYLYRNAYEVMNVLPSAYPWSSAYLVFSQIGNWMERISCDQISGRELKRILKSEQSIPGTFQLHPRLGMIYPESYVDMTMFLKLFSSVKQFETMLVKDYETFISVADSLDESVSFSLEEARDICQRERNLLFPGRLPSTLNNEEKCRLVSTLHQKYHLDEETLSRTLFLSQHIVRQVLQSKQFR